MSQTAKWSVINPVGRYQAIEDTSTTQQHYIGYRVQAWHPTYKVGEFVYLIGVANTIATDWVVYDEAGATIRITAASVGPVGIAMSANVASQYGWYQIFGQAIGGSGGAIVDNALVYATGAGAVGTVDDAVVDGDLVHGAICRSTVSGAVITGTYQLTYPFMYALTGAD